MPVRLIRDAESCEAAGRFLVIRETGDTKTDIPDLARKLEDAFDRAYTPWRDAALKLQIQPGSELAHMPTMSTYASDFGVMLAWVEIVEQLVKETEPATVACEDPWLYRALASLDGVKSDPPPNIAAKRLRFFSRGFLARSLAALRCVIAMMRTRGHLHAPAQASWVLVYGHPDSNAEGFDAYFGDLMKQIPNLRRLMHTDCPAGYALDLARDGRTHALHAWGNLCTALAMPFARWKPDVSGFEPATRWLVERAAAIEGRGGSAAMTRWQIACHENWLKKANPKTVAWPWENHPWERDFSRQARRNGTKTLGYQHTVVGRHMYNQGADANLDGTESIPDQILLNGPSYKEDLRGRGIPAERMTVAGAHRIGAKGLPKYDPAGPVFLALSNNPSFARQMIEACRPLASKDRPFIVKDHPLSPYPVTESENFDLTRKPIPELPPMRALIYCTGTTGLEGLLGGVPTYRFIPEGGVALDILPKGMSPISVSAGELAAALQNPPGAANHAEAADQTAAFPPPDMNVWISLLSDERTNSTND
ncbi:MAG: hypothetical protein JJ855_09280 [Rhodospirillales bacterium]|nr:hypothetical protein [Rhodospirillales bacterium]